MSSALEFIANNKYTYYEWLTQQSNFPFICTSASEVLGSYINAKIENVAILNHGYFEPWIEEMRIWNNKYDFFMNPFHGWLTINNKIIDFTIVQFSDEIPTEYKDSCYGLADDDFLYDFFDILGKYDEDISYNKQRLFNFTFKYSYLYNKTEIKDVIIDKKDSCYWRYYPVKQYQANRFKKLALKSKSFEDYLSLIKNSLQYQNYKYNKGLRKLK